MSKMSAIIMSVVLLTLPSGYLAYSVIMMFLNHAENAPGIVQILSGVMLLTLLPLMIMPVLISLFMGAAPARESKRDEAQEDDEDVEEFASEEELEADEDFDDEAADEDFETGELELSGDSGEFEEADDFGDFDDELDDDDFDFDDDKK